METIEIFSAGCGEIGRSPAPVGVVIPCPLLATTVAAYRYRLR